MNFGKGLLIFVSGMVAGGFVIAKALENHYAQIADEEIEEMKKHTKELIDEAKGVNIKKDEEEPWNKPEESSIESKNKYKSIVRDYTKPEREVIDPGFETKVDRSKPSLESMATNVRQWKEEEEMNKPYIITDDEYAEDNGYAKETVWLYEVDGALVGDNDEVIDNDEDCIGKAILKNVGQYFKDSDTIYVRNDLMQVDFEIGLQHKSFSRDVLGLED